MNDCNIVNETQETNSHVPTVNLPDDKNSNEQTPQLLVTFSEQEHLYPYAQKQEGHEVRNQLFADKYTKNETLSYSAEIIDQIDESVRIFIHI